jgi:hypothetical protein
MTIPKGGGWLASCLGAVVLLAGGCPNGAPGNAFLSNDGQESYWPAGTPVTVYINQNDLQPQSSNP